VDTAASAEASRRTERREIKLAYQPLPPLATERPRENFKLHNLLISHLEYVI
jgi:hypothetical protein